MNHFFPAFPGGGGQTTYLRTKHAYVVLYCIPHISNRGVDASKANLLKKALQ